MKTYLNFGAIVLCITCASYAHAQSVSEFKDVCTIGDTKGESPYHGITYYKLSIDHNHGKATASACTSNAITHPVHIIKVDLQAKGVEPLVRAEGITSTITTIDWAKKSNIIAAINTGFGSKEYNSECENSNSRAAIGYQKSNGKDYSCYVQLPDFPIVGLDKLNHFREIPTAEYGKFIESEVKATLHNAVSAYVYTLVKDGKVVSNTDDSPDQWLTTEARMKDLRVSTHPRTAIGVDKTGRYFYLVVVDGRRKNMTGMNIEELSYCMKNMGAYNAYNLDGGGSSTIVLGDAVKNYPSDYPDDQTSCGNNAQCTNKSCTNESKLRAQYVHLGFKAEKKCTASEEICNNIDDDCNGDVDENMVCDLEDPTYQSMIYDPQNTDVDGDGKADICARGKKGIFCVFTSKDLMTLAKVVDMSDEDGWIDASRYATIRFADFNGDGKADVCARSEQGVICWPSEGTKLGTQTAIIPMSDKDNYNQVQYYSTIRAADITGNGKDELCMRLKDGFQCFAWQDNTWSAPILLGDMSDDSHWNSPEYYSTIRTADVNGDGKADICGRSKTGFNCWLSTGSGFVKGFVIADWSDEKGWNKPQYYQTIRMTDINGDHKADVCARDSEGIVCHLSQGDKFGDAVRGPSLSDAENWNDYDNYSTIVFGDINGDSKDDVCMRGNHQMQCYLSQENAFGSVLKIPEMGNTYGWNNPDHFRTIRMGDIDGDKKMEVCGRSSTGIHCYQYSDSTFKRIDGPELKNSTSWDQVPYYSTIRIGGPLFKTCSLQTEVCDGIDNNCNGQIDELEECSVTPPPQEECTGTIDEDGNCIEKPDTPSECTGTIDEDGNCIEKPDIPSECTGTIDEDGNCIEKPDIPSECTGTIDEDGNCINSEDTTDDTHSSASSDGCSMKPAASAPHSVFGLIMLGCLGWIVRRRKTTAKK